MFQKYNNTHIYTYNPSIKGTITKSQSFTDGNCGGSRLSGRLGQKGRERFVEYGSSNCSRDKAKQKQKHCKRRKQVIKQWVDIMQGIDAIANRVKQISQIQIKVGDSINNKNNNKQRSNKDNKDSIYKQQHSRMNTKTMLYPNKSIYVTRCLLDSSNCKDGSKGIDMDKISQHVIVSNRHNKNNRHKNKNKKSKRQRQRQQITHNSLNPRQPSFITTTKSTSKPKNSNKNKQNRKVQTSRNTVHPQPQSSIKNNTDLSHHSKNLRHQNKHGYRQDTYGVEIGMCQDGEVQDDGGFKNDSGNKYSNSNNIYIQTQGQLSQKESKAQSQQRQQEQQQQYNNHKPPHNNSLPKTYKPLHQQIAKLINLNKSLLHKNTILSHKLQSQQLHKGQASRTLHGCEHISARYPGRQQQGQITEIGYGYLNIEPVMYGHGEEFVYKAKLDRDRDNQLMLKLIRDDSYARHGGQAGMFLPVSMGVNKSKHKDKHKDKHTREYLGDAVEYKYINKNRDGDATRDQDYKVYVHRCPRQKSQHNNNPNPKNSKTEATNNHKQHNNLSAIHKDPYNYTFKNNASGNNMHVDADGSMNKSKISSYHNNPNPYRCQKLDDWDVDPHANLCDKYTTHTIEKQLGLFEQVQKQIPVKLEQSQIKIKAHSLALKNGENHNQKFQKYRDRYVGQYAKIKNKAQNQIRDGHGDVSHDLSSQGNCLNYKTDLIRYPENYINNKNIPYRNHTTVYIPQQSPNSTKIKYQTSSSYVHRNKPTQNLQQTKTNPNTHLNSYISSTNNSNSNRNSNRNSVIMTKNNKEANQIEELQKQFDRLTQISHLERNRMKKRAIWEEMRKIAKELKMLRNFTQYQYGYGDENDDRDADECCKRQYINLN